MALHEPKALLELLDAERSAEMFLEGLRLHWLEAYANGNVEAWRATGHAVVDFLCDLPRIDPAHKERRE